MSPRPGSTLPRAVAAFSWSAGAGATQYWLSVGTTGAGSGNVYAQSQGTSVSATVSGLPVDGSPVYVRLWTLLGGTWQFNDYTYTAATLNVGGTDSPVLSVAQTDFTSPAYNGTLQQA